MKLSLDEALKKALVLHSNDKIEAAQTIYNKIIMASPNHPIAHYNMATLLMQKQEFIDAIDHLNIAIDQNKKTTQIWYALTLAYFLQGEFQTALKTIGDAAQNVDLDSAFMELRQKILLQIKESDSVTAAPAQYVAELIDKVSYEVTPEILNELKNATMRYPLSEQIEQLNGLALAQSGDTQKAISHYHNALIFNPKNPAIYNNIGLCLRNLSKFPEAVKSFKKAIEIKNDYLKANFNLASTCNQLGIYREAIDYYRAVLDIRPDYLPAKVALANIYSDFGFSSEAGELIAGIDILSANDQASLLALTNHYNNTGQFERSEEILIDYSKENGASETINITLLSTAFHLNNYMRVINLSLELIKSNRKGFCPFTYLGFGLVLLEHANPSLLENEMAKIKKTALKNQLSMQFKALQYRLYCYSLDRKDDFLSEYRREDKRVTHVSELRQSLPPDVAYFVEKTKIFALVHCGRSGTGLLHSLIDNHPEISTLPSVYFSEFFHPQTWAYLTRLGQQSLVDEFCKLYPCLFNATDPTPVRGPSNVYRKAPGAVDGMICLGEDKTQVQKLDLIQFKNNLVSLIECYENVTHIEFFKLLHVAYELVLNGELKPKKSIFYHIHNPEVVSRLNLHTQEQNLSWIILYREPLRSLESWLTPKMEKAYNLFDQYTMILGVIDVFYIPIYRDPSTITLKLEDIKTNPKNTLKNLCSCIGISYHDSLSTMTVQGMRWWGDPASPDYNKDGMLPFGTTSIKRKLGQVFSQKDLEFFTNLYSHFSYELMYTETFDPDNLDKCLEFIATKKLFDFETKYISELGVEPSVLSTRGSFIYFRHRLSEILRYIKSL